jgi:hypothetical protein
MEVLLGIFFCLFAAMVAGVMVWRVSQGEPLLSTLHFFLAGFIIFQLTSAALAFFFEAYGEIKPSSPTESGLLYAMYLLAFFGFFILAFKTGIMSFGLDRRLGTSFPVPGSMTLLALAYGLFGVSAFIRFVLAYVPFISPLALVVYAGVAAAAVGLACWAWARHWNNPVYVLLAGMLVLAAVGMVIYQNFGRRDLTSVVLCAAWGAYHGHFKRISLARAALPLAVVTAFGLVVVAAFTASRTERIVSLSFTTVVGNLFSANILNGLYQMFSGQEAATNAMYLIETRPDGIPYDTLHSLYYGVSLPVPRVFWQSKPEPLGLTMVPEYGVKNKSPGYNVGPGMIGHVVNDNVWICLWLYPILLAAGFRVMDRLLTRFADNPFVVVPLGVALGEITAMPRGEFGLFLSRGLTNIVSAYALLWCTAKVMIMLGFRFRALEESAEDAPEPQDEGELVDLELQRRYTRE